MSAESFTCCDNPACSSAVRDDSEDLEAWYHACYSRHDHPEGEDMPEVDACCLECLFIAIRDNEDAA